MFFEILLALLLGVLCGIFTGITPGIHVNLVSLLVLSSSAVLLQFTLPVVVGVFIISLAITHTFLDALPSIYLGAPDEAQALNVLPGHRLLHRGAGHAAVTYTVIGALGSLLLGIVLFPLFIQGMTLLQPYVSKVMGYLLALVMIFLIGREHKKWVKSLTLFLLSGCLGLLVFSIPNLKQPLFPLLSGLFGLSILIVSLAQKSKIPPQNLHAPLIISKKNLGKAVSASTTMGFVAAFLPGFGSAQAATVATTVVRDIGDEGFLIMVGGINTANMLLSIATAFALEKSRNGAILVVNTLLEGIGFEEMLIFVAVALAVGGIAAIVTLWLSRSFARWIGKVNYKYLGWGIILFIAVLTIFFDGILGLIILITATAIGLLASSWGLAKSHLMGCLILPVILYFLL